MAVQYIGTSISGLAADTKPTPSGNEKGLLFVETDTNKLYQWDTDSWNLLSNAATQVTVTDNITGCFIKDTVSIPGYGNIVAYFSPNKT